MKSARINFGIPDSEYIVQVDDTGAATSCYNQDTETEYVGGGGTFYTISNSEDSTINIGLLVSADTSMTNGVPAIIELFAGESISIPNNYYYLVQKEFTTADGSIEEVEIEGTQYYLITGDASFLIED